MCESQVGMYHSSVSLDNKREKGRALSLPFHSCPVAGEFIERVRATMSQPGGIYLERWPAPWKRLCLDSFASGAPSRRRIIILLVIVVRVFTRRCPSALIVPCQLHTQGSFKPYYCITTEWSTSNFFSTNKKDEFFFHLLCREKILVEKYYAFPHEKFNTFSTTRLYE